MDALAVRRVQVATGVSLGYVELGDVSRRSVLLLHAWGESLRCFDRLFPLLDAHHVFAVDQRGHGSADKPAVGYDLESLAADVEAFMDEVGLPSAVLVGSSSGGYVAQQVAVRAPDRVDALVLLGSPLSLRGRPPFADDVNKLTDPIDAEWVREFLTWFPRSHDVPGWYLDDRVHDALCIPAAVWRRSLAGLATSQVPTEVGEITVPTLIVWGDDDPLLPRDDQDTLADRIVGSTLVTYEKCGHLVLWEQPDRVASEIAWFIATLRR